MVYEVMNHKHNDIVCTCYSEHYSTVSKYLDRKLHVLLLRCYSDVFA